MSLDAQPEYAGGMVNERGPGERARKIREAASVTRERAAQRIGISLRTLARWENGEQSPPADLPQQMAKIVGQGVDQPSLEHFTTLELAQEIERRLRLREPRQML